MSVRFAILKEMFDTKGTVSGEATILEYDQELILFKLQANIKAFLVQNKRFFQSKYSETEVNKAVETAWENLVDEFHKKTVKII